MIFLTLILTVLAVRVAVIRRPFIANQEGMAAGWVLSSTTNYIRYGPWAARLAGVMNSGEVTSENWVVYAHHPPLTLLLGALAMRLFGDEAWKVRLVPAAFSIATTALLFLIARRRFGLRVATVAGVIYAFCPLTLALGDMAEFLNAPLVFCGVATVESCLRWIETRRRVWLCLSCLAFVMGALSDWPIFYLVPILAAHILATRAARPLHVAVFVVVAALLFAALAGWVVWAGSDVSVFEQLAIRVSTQKVTLQSWIRRVVLHHQGVMHTWPVLALTVVYLVHVARLRRRGELSNSSPHALPLLLGAWSLLHLAVGIDGTHRHEWWSMPLTPMFALMAALGLERIIRRLPPVLRVPSVAWPLGAVAVLAFVGWSAWTAYDSTFDQWFHGDGYTLQSIGTVIHDASAPTEGVLTSVDTDYPPLWAYADRQLRPAIRSVEKLEHALSAGPYLLFYRYTQPSGPAPTWFVMPSSDQAELPELTTVLNARYPRRETDGVIVYRLRP